MLNAVISQEHSLIAKFSSLHKLFRIISWVFHFISNLKCKSMLLSLRIEYSELFWTKQTQIFHFAKEYSLLATNKSISGNSHLIKLNPFFDKFTECIRVGGRLKQANLSEFEIHSFILPSGSIFTKLVIKSYHHRTLHAGPQLTISLIRERYWIIQSRRAVKSVISKCLPCIRYQSTTMSQMTGNLLNRSEVFSHVGIDYAGPLKMKISSGRGQITAKAYIAVFICFCIKAIHLEANTKKIGQGKFI